MHRKIASINHIRNSLESLYSGNNKAPTTLFELLKSQYERVTKNSIHLSGVSINTVEVDGKIRKVLYSRVKYGSNINMDQISIWILNE